MSKLQNHLNLFLLLSVIAFVLSIYTTFPIIQRFSIAFASDDLTPSTARPLEQRAQTNKTAAAIEDLVCKKDDHAQEEEWGNLCSGGFAMAAAQQLLDGEDVDIVQIGAHVGFEVNDPLTKGISRLLDEVAAAVVDESDKRKIRQRFHWTFVEPSPPNFHRLAENLSNHSAVCDMKGINAAVISDSLDSSSNNKSTNNTSEIKVMPFYSLSETIDPETGYDSLSGKTLPFWITQVSSFSLSPIRFNAGVFRRNGLNYKDYVVVTNVTTLPFSELMQQAMHAAGAEGKKSASSATATMNENKPPLLVLIDVEGFDCDIIKGMSPSSTVLPKYLVFEHKQCDREGASEHLQKKLSYDLFPLVDGSENTVAVKKDVTGS